MEIEVRVVRARVWLSSSLFLHQDGFLSLTRVGGMKHVAHATLRSVEGNIGNQCSLADVALQQQKCYRTATVVWEERVQGPGSDCPTFCLPEAPVLLEGSFQARNNGSGNQPPVLPRLDFQLFLVKPRSRGSASARSRPQTVYLGASGWQLSEKDVEALSSSREVVFLTTLQHDLGTLEVKLRCVCPNDLDTRTGKASGRNIAEDNDAEISTGFNINWSSSEALQKDLAEKGMIQSNVFNTQIHLVLIICRNIPARLKAEADMKLIVQLKQTAAKTAKLLESRNIVLGHLRRSRAASRIQRRFRVLQHKKQELTAKRRAEEEARTAAKKAQVRDKVIARNRQRALAMRTRLLGHLDNSNYSRELGPEDSASLQEAKRIAELLESERTKLKERLEILEMQRQQLASSTRSNAVRSNQHSPLPRSENLFDEELVRAVQELHFSRTYSNQMQ
ncbi:unnamed protein product [Phytophthora fragariaefolia]|uniref:Unnamed protein product n=1 Tax=Phytophthora fragariaefolia TaxID=1490495 RepID=A0A9W7CR94_9STRA|nr:unnamed protein product [Phytophthora fragariaefolia]